MDLFGSHNIAKMAAEHDLDGLYKLLEQSNQATRLEAAQALAEMEDGVGWRFLMDAVRKSDDPDVQATAAAMLGDLGHPRAIPVLEEALKIAVLKVASNKADQELADTIKEALEAIGGREADEALRRAGYEPVLPFKSGEQVTNYEGEYVRTVMPDTSHVEFLTAEQHLNNAVELREAELAERGLVEDSLSLWLASEQAYAWYLRGVLFEDLDRNFEAALCYRWALELDPAQADAREALADLETDRALPSLNEDLLLSDLAARSWSERRDAAAGLGDLGENAPAQAVGRLIELLDDEEREVRHAAIEALGNIGNRQAVLPLIQHEEGSWLLRFSTVEALAQLGSVDGLATVLRREMNHIQERNPVFSSHKDPLVEVEYDRLMEIGVLAFEKAGDLQALLTQAEGNAWTIDTDEEEYAADGQYGAGNGAYDAEEAYSEDEEDLEADENLEAYVDEVAQMVSLALERLAMPQLPSLDIITLQRLAAVPDLTLLDVSEEDSANEEEEETESEPIMIHDLSALRQAAKAELAKR